MSRCVLRLGIHARTSNSLGCTGATRELGYWFGHETVEDRQKALQRIEDAKLVQWKSPDSSAVSTENRNEGYALMRVEKEEKALHVKYDLQRMNMVDWFGFLNYPHGIYGWVKHPAIHAANQRVTAYQKLIYGQRFMRDRVMALGPDLAAASFLLGRNCRVRFKGKDMWFTYRHSPMLPVVWVEGWHVEEIDASCSNLIYEGIQSLRNLVFLKTLDVSYSPHIDDWCMDRITGEYQDSLEEIDLSGCKAINWSGLECLWRLRKLKVLTLKDMDHIADLKLLCLMLIEEFPHLEIRGVDYEDRKLLEGTPDHHLLEEFESMLLDPGKIAAAEEPQVSTEPIPPASSNIATADQHLDIKEPSVVHPSKHFLSS